MYGVRSGLSEEGGMLAVICELVSRLVTSEQRSMRRAVLVLTLVRFFQVCCSAEVLYMVTYYQSILAVVAFALLTVVALALVVILPLALLCERVKNSPCNACQCGQAA